MPDVPGHAARDSAFSEDVVAYDAFGCWLCDLGAIYSRAGAILGFDWGVWSCEFGVGFLVAPKRMIMILLPLVSPRSQPPLVLSVPLSRFASRVGGGFAFFVKQL